MRVFNTLVQLALLVFALWFISACSEKEFDPNDPAKSYQIAKEPYDDKRWEDAIRRLGEFKSRFPYSQFAIESELLMGNAQFELERYAEAAATYEQFVKLHPKHAKIDYAMYRVGESYWAEAPDSIDREQDYTVKAIEEWQKLMERVPESDYAKKAKDLVATGRKRLAANGEFIADFYCRLEIFHSCAYRFTKLAQDFPDAKDLKSKSLRSASDALIEVAKAKDEDPTSDKNIYFKTMNGEQIRQKAAELRKESEQ